jgi:hypothetical protein
MMTKTDAVTRHNLFQKSFVSKVGDFCPPKMVFVVGG